MPSQFFGLNIAYTGLLASNAALNTTNNNIANVHTKGYSRQQVVQQASDAIRVFQTYGCAGAGVDTLAIERVRDDFYDGKYWANNTRLGEFNMKQYYMEQMETYFDDDGSNAGFKTIFDQVMIGGMQELLKNPASVNTKTQFIGFMSGLTGYFTSLSGNMQAMQTDVNHEIKLKVDQINSLANEIASLNKQINTVELTGSKANELRDRRTLLLDDLSQIVDIQVKETPIVDPYHPDRKTGGNRFMVQIAGGQVLVDTNEYRELECVARRSYEKVNQTDVDGLYDIYWEDGQKFNLYNVSMGGSLKGLVQMRDGNNGEYFNGMVTDVGSVTIQEKDDKGVMRDVVHDTVTVQVGKAYLQDLNQCNLSDQGGVINLANQEFYYDSWEYTCSFDAQGNATYSYTFTLSKAGSGEKNARHVTNDRKDKEATIGAGISYQGIPYYMKQMNEWIRTFSQKFNDLLTSGYTADNQKGIIMLTGNDPAEDAQFLFDEKFRYDLFTAKGEAGKSIKVSSRDDSYYRLTADNFDILAAVSKDPNRMANKFDISAGADQKDLLEAIKGMAYDKEKMSFRGASAGEFLQCILGDIALNTSNAEKFQQNFKDIAETIENQRISISGVDEDEEAVNLVKYQNGYNLAAKMMQVLTEVYDRLILETGV